jgi:hypothetical protein
MELTWFFRFYLFVDYKLHASVLLLFLLGEARVEPSLTKQKISISEAEARVNYENARSRHLHFVNLCEFFYF